MIEIATGVLAGLQINGADFPLENGGFRSIKLVSNMRLQTMSAQIVIADIAKRFDTSNTIGDGTPITLQLGKSTSTYDTYNMRVFSAPSDPSSGSMIYTITAYWDSYKWFMETTNTSITGTSADAISQIAQNCGLVAVVDPTADQQTWRPGNKRHCAFARDICNHGYASDNGLLVLGQAMNGEIRYRDLSRIQTTNSMPTFLHTDTLQTQQGMPAYQVDDHQFMDVSGFKNARGGYQSQMIEQSVLNAAASVVHSNVQVRRLTQMFNINKGIHNSIRGGRVEIGLVDCGNTHQNYYKAKYQNERGRQTFSTGVSLLTRQMTTGALDLFDPFLYTPVQPGSDGQINPDDRNKAVYIVTAKCIEATAGNYLEKIEGMSQGPSVDPANSGMLL